MNPEWLKALIGGVLIGISVSLMLLFNGRVTGISGILYGLIKPVRGEIGWRLSFVAGLILGGLALAQFNPEVFATPVTSFAVAAVAGVFVGFGTTLGNGCTSGHGVCGISRFSLRSAIATLLFITLGIVTVTVIQGFHR